MQFSIYINMIEGEVNCSINYFLPKNNLNYLPVLYLQCSLPIQLQNMVLITMGMLGIYT